MDVIRLKNILIYARHGVHQGENELGGQFEIDLDCYTHLKSAGISDDISHTLDYSKLYNCVVERFTNKPYKLIETAAESICKNVLTHFDVDRVTVRIRKPHAPMDAILDTVEIELTRRPSDYE